MPDVRYPIGPFEVCTPPDSGMRLTMLSELAQAPNRLRAAVAGLTDRQLDTPYRPAGWSVRQVVHHLADAHMNWVHSNPAGPYHEQWKRKIIHPDRGVFVLDAKLPMHVWHGRHHTAHILELRKRLGWK